MANRTKKSKSSNSNGIVASNDFSTLKINELEEVKDNSNQEVKEDELDELLEPANETSIAKNDNSFLQRLTPELQDKLDKFDKLEKHCVELETENAKLIDSINSYVEEIESLKLSKNSSKEFDEVKKELSAAKKSLTELREENDSYLMKISELTFENAKLTSQVQELEKSISMVASPTHAGGKPAIKPSTSTMRNQPQFTNPYLQNGYQDWK